MDSEELYSTLRSLTSPVVAITSRAGDSLNGMIANSAIRASLLPDHPRVAFYCFKKHYSHELMTQSGRFCLHLLHQNQLALVQKLGFESGRETNKLKNVEYSLTESNLPLLSNSAAYFDCEIINAMDAGPSTFFMGQVRASGRHDEFDSLTLMTSDYLRNQLSDEWKELYRQNKRDVQEWARQHLEVDPSYEWDPK